MQVIERVGEKPTYLAQRTLTESIITLETDLEIESDQPPLAPDMSPIIRPEVKSIEMSMPCFPLELFMNSMEIYLAQEEVS